MYQAPPLQVEVRKQGYEEAVLGFGHKTFYYMLRASCLTLEINEFRCYEAKIEESEKSRQSPGVEPKTPLA